MPVKSTHRLCTEAAQLLDIGRDKDALALLHEAAAKDPDNGRVHCLRAQAHYSLDHYWEAIAAAEKAAGINPFEEWPHRIRALSLRHVNRKKEALEAARECVRRAPEEPMAYYALALCLSDLRRIQEAREAASTMRQLAPEIPLTHLTAGLVAQADKRWSEAEEHYRRALALDPENWPAMNNLGLVYNKLGKRKEAIEMLHNAARIRPDEKLPRENLKNSVQGYVAGGVGMVYVVLQIVRVGVRTAGGNEHAMAAAMFLPVLIGAMVYFAWRRHKRMGELHESVREFYVAEVRRERRASSRRIGVATLVALTALPIFFWSIGALTDSPAAVGLTSWPVVVYVALWIGLGVEVWWLIRTRATAQGR